MKKLLLFLSLAVTVFYSCSKESKPKDEDTEPADEQEFVEISSFSLHSSYLQLAPSMTEGLVLQVEDISPRNSPMSLLECSVDKEGIVSIKRDPYGFRVFPEGVGTATITVRTTAGKASEKTCSVEVLEQAVYDTPELTSISAEQTEFELSDKPSSGGAMQGDRVDVQIILEPSDAKLNATEIYTDRPEILNLTQYNNQNRLRIEAEPNLEDKESVTGKFHIYVNAKRGTAKPLVLTVDVFGHVYGAEFMGVQEGKPGVEMMGKELGLNITTGDEINLKPEVLTTGPLKQGEPKVSLNFCELSGDNLIPSDAKCVELSDDGVLKAVANTVSKAPIKFYVAALQEGEKVPLGKFPIVIYDKVESVEILSKSASLDAPFRVGQSYEFQAVIQPATARQEFDWEFNTNYFKEVSRSGYKIKVQCIKSSLNGERITVKTKQGKSNSVSIKIDDYTAADIKPGDWVYYNTATQSFRVSDGGLRVFDEGQFRDEKIAPNPSKSETIVGVIFDINVDQTPFTVKLAGYNGTHFRAVSVSDGKEYQWSDGSSSVQKIAEDWDASGAISYCKAPVEGNTNDMAFTTFEQNQGWRKYNNYVSATNRVKAMYSIDDYAENHPIKVATMHDAGASGWLLINYREVRLLETYYKICNDNRLKMSGYGFTPLGNYYWTCNYPALDVRADLLVNDNGSFSIKDKARSSKYATRPIFYL